MTRTAREVVELYNLVVWNTRGLRARRGTAGRHRDPPRVGEVNVLTHEEAVRRVVDTWEMFDDIRFDLNLIVAGDDGEHVGLVYQSPMRLRTAPRSPSAVWRSSGWSTAGSPRCGTVATSKECGSD